MGTPPYGEWQEDAAGRADVGIGPYAPIFHLFGFLFSPLSPSIGIVDEEFLTKCGRFGHPANF